MNLKVGWFYPDLMSTYGDRGNIIALKRRCEVRKITVEVVYIGKDKNSEDIKKCDLLFMGGAQDRQQEIVEKDLRKKGKVICDMLDSGVPGLFVCGAYQFLGKEYQGYERIIKGVGIFDLVTKHAGKDRPRCVGNIVIRVEIEGDEILVVGFENHGGRTYLGKNVKPFGKVVKGFGNNGQDKSEGIWYKNAIGTYLHGPILPKNPGVADYLIKRGLERKCGNKVKLEAVDDELENEARDYILKKLGI